MIWGGLSRLALVVLAVLLYTSSCFSTSKHNSNVSNKPPAESWQQDKILSPPFVKKGNSCVEHFIQNNVSCLKQFNNLELKHLDNVSVNYNKDETRLNQVVANVQNPGEISKLNWEDIPSRNVLSKAFDLIWKRNQTVEPANDYDEYESNSTDNLDDSEVQKINLNLNDNSINNLSFQQISNDYNSLLNDFINETKGCSLSWVITDKPNVVMKTLLKYVTNNIFSANTSFSNVDSKMNLQKESIPGLNSKTLSLQSNLKNNSIYEIHNKTHLTSTSDISIREDIVLTHREIKNVNDVNHRPFFNLIDSKKNFSNKNSNLVTKTLSFVSSNGNDIDYKFVHLPNGIEENHKIVNNETSNKMNRAMKEKSVINLTLSTLKTSRETPISSLFAIKKIKADLLETENIPNVHKLITENKASVNKKNNVSELFVYKTVSSNASKIFQNVSFPTTSHSIAAPLPFYSLKNAANETGINNILLNSRTDSIMKGGNVNDTYTVVKNENKSALGYNIKTEDVSNYNLKNNHRAKLINGPSTLRVSISLPVFIINYSYYISNNTTSIMTDMPIQQASSLTGLPIQQTSIMTDMPIQQLTLNPTIPLIFQPKQLLYSTALNEINNIVSTNTIVTSSNNSANIAAMSSKITDNNYYYYSTEINNIQTYDAKYSFDKLQTLYLNRNVSQEIVVNATEANYQKNFKSLEQTKCAEDDQLNRRVYHQYTVFERHEDNVIPTSAVETYTPSTNSYEQMIKVNSVINNQNRLDNETSDKIIVTSGETSIMRNYNSPLENSTKSLMFDINKSFSEINSMIALPLTTETITVRKNQSEDKLKSIDNNNKDAKFDKILFQEHQISKANFQETALTHANFHVTELGIDNTNRSNNMNIRTSSVMNDFNAVGSKQVKLTDLKTSKVGNNELMIHKINDRKLIPVINDSNARLVDDRKSLDDLGVTKASTVLTVTATENKIDRNNFLHSSIYKNNSRSFTTVEPNVVLDKVKLKKDFGEDMEESGNKFINSHPKVVKNNLSNKTYHSYVNTLFGKQPQNLFPSQFYSLYNVEPHYYNNHIVNNTKGVLPSREKFNKLAMFKSDLNSLLYSKVLKNFNHSESNNDNTSNEMRTNFVDESKSDNGISPIREFANNLFLNSGTKFNLIDETNLFKHNNLNSKNIDDTTNKFRNISISDLIKNLHSINKGNLDLVPLTGNKLNNRNYYISYNKDISHLHGLVNASNKSIHAGTTSLRIYNQQNNKKPVNFEGSELNTLMTGFNSFNNSTLVNITERYDFTMSNNYNFMYNSSLNSTSFKLNNYNQSNNNLQSVTSLNNLLNESKNYFSSINNSGSEIQSYSTNIESFIEMNNPRNNISSINHEEHGSEFNNSFSINKYNTVSTAKIAAIPYHTETLVIPDPFRFQNETPLNISNYLSVETSTDYIFSDYKLAHNLSFDNETQVTILSENNDRYPLKENLATDNYVYHMSTKAVTMSNNHELKLSVSNNKHMVLQSVDSSKTEHNMTSLVQTKALLNNKSIETDLENKLQINFNMTTTNAIDKHKTIDLTANVNDNKLNPTNSDNHLINSKSNSSHNSNFNNNLTNSNLDQMVNTPLYVDVTHIESNGIENNIFRTTSSPENVINTTLNKVVIQNNVVSSSESNSIDEKTSVDSINSKTSNTFFVKLPLVTHLFLQKKGFNSAKIINKT